MTMQQMMESTVETFSGERETAVLYQSLLFEYDKPALETLVRFSSLRQKGGKGREREKKKTGDLAR